MKKLLGMVLALGFIITIGAMSDLRADGCYLCQGGGYVKYIGSDTFDKRKKAEKIGCKVSGTTGSCSNPKGVVD